MAAAQITAWCTGIAAVIAAIGAVLKIVLTRPRLPVAEEVLERLAEVEEALLSWATWAHQARMVAAAAGIELPPVPLDLGEKRTPPGLPARLTGPDSNPLPAQRIGARHRG